MPLNYAAPEFEHACFGLDKVFNTEIEVKSVPFVDITCVIEPHAGPGAGFVSGAICRFSGSRTDSVMTGSDVCVPWMRSSLSTWSGRSPPTTTVPWAVSTVY